MAVYFGISLQIEAPHKSGRSCIQLMAGTILAQSLDSQAAESFPQSLHIMLNPRNPPNILGPARVYFHNPEAIFFDPVLECDPSFGQASHRTQGDREERDFSSSEFQIAGAEMLSIPLVDGFSPRRQREGGIYSHQVRFFPADDTHDIIIRVDQ